MKIIKLYKKYWINSGNFSDESSRMEFWVPQLINLFLGSCFYLIISLTPLKSEYSSSNFFIKGLEFFWQFFLPLLIFIPDLSLFFRRFKAIEFKHYSKLVILYGFSVLGNLLIKFFNIFFNLKIGSFLTILSTFFFVVVIICYIVSFLPSKSKGEYDV